MSTINVSEKTKERFKLLKLDTQAEKKTSLSQDSFMNFLIDNLKSNEDKN